MERPISALSAPRSRPSARGCVAELGEAIQPPGQMTYGSQAAAASQVFEQQRDLALRDRAEPASRAGRGGARATRRGTYGACLRCGQPIAPARLEALPWAAHCIECQSAIDKGRR